MARNSTNRENQRYPYGSRRMDRYETGHQNDFGFADDSDFDSRSSMYQRGRNEYGPNVGRGKSRFGNDYRDERPRQESEGEFDFSQSRPEDWGHYNKGPKGWKRSDERIKEDACEALSDSYEVDASDIDVAVKDSEVILSGTVKDRGAKQAAERCVEHIRGVVDVHNQLRIKRSSEEKRGTKLS